jgi:hypothetical protein
LHNNSAGSYEIGPIRPPSEASSLFVRVTRNCPWNRCRFCHIYKGARFSVRTVEEIKKDIDVARNYAAVIQDAPAEMDPGNYNDSFYNVARWLRAGGQNVFLQDANSLVLPTEQLLEILQYLKSAFPGIRRVTSYARSHTAARKTLQEMQQLHEAGLSRLHLGLETGCDPVLACMDKGVTAEEHIRGGRNVVASGISLSEYVLLGIGGKKMRQEHAAATGKVLSAINPDYIRFRTLTINDQMPLYEDVANGKFLRCNDEDTAREVRVILENLDCTSKIVSDHTTNLLQEIEGQMPGDKSRLLDIVDRFLGLSPEDKTNFELGRRLGLYYSLADMENPVKRQTVEQYTGHIVKAGPEAIDKIIWELMERFI